MYLLEEGLELSANTNIFCPCNMQEQGVVPITILSCESAEMIQ